MIHYTLLPEKELRALKREYRIRAVIFFLFFLSCSIFLGIISLLPAYIYSYSQEKDSIASLNSLKSKRTNSEVENVSKELEQTSLMVSRLKGKKDQVIYSSIINEIVKNKNSGLTINSFNFSSQSNATSSISTIIQGKAGTRESLIQFKNKLESDPNISDVELPVSDLAKSKNISYSIKLSISTKQ